MEIIGEIPNLISPLNGVGILFIAVGLIFMMTTAINSRLDFREFFVSLVVIILGTALAAPGIIATTQAEDEFIQKQVSALEEHYGVPVDADVVDIAVSRSSDVNNTTIRPFTKVVDGEVRDMGLRIVDNHIFIYEKPVENSDYRELEPVK